MIESFKIERDGREYAVAVHHDECASNPRENYERPATQFLVTQYTYSRWDTYVDETHGLRATASGVMQPNYAGEALRHFLNLYREAGYRDWGGKVVRAFELWRALTLSPVVLVTGQDHGYSQSDWHYWFALVDTSIMARDGYGGTPETVAKSEADEYAAYAYGDVFGVEVTSPEGESESLWGIVDREGSYVRETAEELADGLASDWRDEMAARAVAASSNGAGFITYI